MKTKLSLILMLLVFGASYTCFGQVCANPSNIYNFSFNGKDYMVVKEKKTWANAAACAVELGGYLAQIGNSTEQAAIYDAIINGASVPANYTNVPDGGGIAYVWIGATDQGEEGKWLWNGANGGNGTWFWQGEGDAGAGGGYPIMDAYVNWGGTSTGTWHEPDNYAGIQDAAGIALNGWPGGSGTLGIAGEWNDLNPNNALYFVVEMISASIINNSQNNNLVNFFPNPAKGKVSITTMNGLNIVSFTIYDLTGNKRFTQESAANQSMVVNLDNLAPGLYLTTTVLSNESTVNKRLIIQKD